MSDSPVMIIGAVCFGLVAGYITYRTLVRSTQATTVSDLAAVLAAIGGGAVVKLYEPTGDLFGWYAIGLPIGMIVYIVALGWLKAAPQGSARRDMSAVLGAGRTPEATGDGDAGSPDDAQGQQGVGANAPQGLRKKRLY